VARHFKACDALNVLFLLTATAVIYVVRISGFMLKTTTISPFWVQFLRFVPIAVFTAFVVSALYHDTSFLSGKMIAFAIAGVSLWRTKQFGLSVIIGLAIMFLLSR
jgi:branched-subunit amino acid transport protein